MVGVDVGTRECGGSGCRRIARGVWHSRHRDCGGWLTAVAVPVLWRRLSRVRRPPAPPRGQEREFRGGEHRDGGKQAEGADA